jgi:hypothetical protein
MCERLGEEGKAGSSGQCRQVGVDCHPQLTRDRRYPGPIAYIIGRTGLRLCATAFFAELSARR